MTSPRPLMMSSDLSNDPYRITTANKLTKLFNSCEDLSSLLSSYMNFDSSCDIPCLREIDRTTLTQAINMYYITRQQYSRIKNPSQKVRCCGVYFLVVEWFR